MDISSVNSDLIRGNVTTIILGCLAASDRYGYEILKEIEDRSTGQYALKQATLYNQLKRLEKQGLVSSYDGDDGDTGGAKRRYYRLTPEGREYLSREKSEYEYSRTILDKLVSAKEYDFSNPVPFDASELRPYSKREAGEEKPKVVYKDKLVEVERTVYLDRFGNHVTEQEAAQLANQARLEEEANRQREVEISSLRDQLSQKTDEADELNRRHDEVVASLREQLAQKNDETDELNRRHDEEVAALREQLAQKTTEADDLSRQRNENVKQASLAERELSDARRQLQTSEEERRNQAERIQALEEEQRKRAEEDRLLEEEEERRKNSQHRPAQTLEELFAKLDAQSEYEKEEASPAEKPEEQRYFESEVIANDNSTLLGAMHRDEVAADTSAVLNRAGGSFEYENSDVNYREFFYGISEQKQEPVAAEETVKTDAPDGDIRMQLYQKGFKIRPYDRGNTSEYYTFNFLQKNRITRDTFLIVLAFFLVEMAILWASLAKRITYVYFLPIVLVGTVLCLVPTVVYLTNPTKRVRANFNFKLSILNRTMAFIEITLVCMLIGFFALGASVNDIDLILCSIVIPAIICLNLPLSSVIYWLLYRTRKYHTA